MSLFKKRKLFFTLVTILFMVIFGSLMFHPILQWLDNATINGAMVMGIPLAQFWVLLASVCLAVLIAVVFYVDTKILAVRVEDIEEEKNN